ncbi:hypothetical protein MSPP1_002925 [Malassezia sp. CBS 17886]|nr:hypothetical protein MSPP1_002925 [Malassezia sp. CBS 17886]
MPRAFSARVPQRVARRTAAFSTTTSAARADVVLGEAIRELMRSSAQPVAIVSAFLPGEQCEVDAAESERARENGIPVPRSPPPTHIHAATLSSFTTVSLSPPLVAFSIRIPSRLADALYAGATIPAGASRPPADARERRPHFLVHLLSDKQTALSTYFAQPGATPFALDTLGGAPAANTDHPFVTHNTHPSATVEGQLLLQDSIGALACSLVYELDLTSPDLHGTAQFQRSDKGASDVGSALFLARIHAVEHAPRSAESAGPADLPRPLVYWNRNYYTVS